jgi:7,8-dihydropterin-6-yl-methyl-4-(beta-D-ribofuranosyl)aminobenzene 5'-phosphate synthase
MKISILTENCAGSHFQAEHGLSYLIEIDGEKILFDTGHSDVFLKNAQKMDLHIHNDVKKVVLSHGHWDHTYGLKYLENKIIITHPRSLDRMLATDDLKNVRLNLTPEQLEEKFDLQLTQAPQNITENLYFLGEIPRANDFESQTTYFTDERGKDDFIPDDTALAAKIGNELIIITGCSHSGICNITEYAKLITGISDVKAILGGFHLKEKDEQTEKTIEYFQKNQVKKMYPSHCTQLPALSAFYEAFNTQQLKTGMVLEF